MSISAGHDRRTCERYRTVQYVANVQRRGWLGNFKSQTEAAVLDFNRNGAALCCDKRFKEGDQVKLTIQSPWERISNIHGVVRHVHRHKGECHLGLQFVEGNDFNAALSNAGQSILAGMEAVIMHQLA